MAADQYCLKWNNHQSTLLVQFETLLESDSLTDCTLSAEGKYLNVHKVLLSACSPYFSKLLGEHKDKHPIFFMKDVAFEELKGIVEYMYKGEVNIMQERLDSFLKTASSLQIKGLADQDGGKSEERDEMSDPGGGRVKRKPAPDLRSSYGEQSPLPEEPRSPKRRRRPRPVSQDDTLPPQDQNHCDTTTAAPAFVQQQQEVVMPTPLVPVKKTEPMDNSMMNLKTEIPDDVPQVDVQDLTLDDDEDFNNEDITQPGTSFSETSQDFAQWQQQMATQSGADESFMAATQGLNQSGSQQQQGDKLAEKNGFRCKCGKVFTKLDHFSYHVKNHCGKQSETKQTSCDKSTSDEINKKTQNEPVRNDSDDQDNPSSRSSNIKLRINVSNQKVDMVSGDRSQQNSGLNDSSDDNCTSVSCDDVTSNNTSSEQYVTINSNRFGTDASVKSNKVCLNINQNIVHVSVTHDENPPQSSDKCRTVGDVSTTNRLSVRKDIVKSHLVASSSVSDVTPTSSKPGINNSVDSNGSNEKADQCSPDLIGRISVRKDICMSFPKDKTVSTTAQVDNISNSGRQLPAGCTPLRAQQRILTNVHLQSPSGGLSPSSDGVTKKSFDSNVNQETVFSTQEPSSTSSLSVHISDKPHQQSPSHNRITVRKDIGNVSVERKDSNPAKSTCQISNETVVVNADSSRLSSTLTLIDNSSSLCRISVRKNITKDTSSSDKNIQNEKAHNNLKPETFTSVPLKDVIRDCVFPTPRNEKQFPLNRDRNNAYENQPSSLPLSSNTRRDSAIFGEIDCSNPRFDRASSSKNQVLSKPRLERNSESLMLPKPRLERNQVENRDSSKHQLDGISSSDNDVVFQGMKHTLKPSLERNKSDKHVLSESRFDRITLSDNDGVIQNIKHRFDNIVSLTRPGLNQFIPDVTTDKSVLDRSNNILSSKLLICPTKKKTSNFIKSSSLKKMRNIRPADSGSNDPPNESQSIASSQIIDKDPFVLFTSNESVIQSAQSSSKDDSNQKQPNEDPSSKSGPFSRTSVANTTLVSTLFPGADFSKNMPFSNSNLNTAENKTVQKVHSVQLTQKRKADSSFKLKMKLGHDKKKKKMLKKSHKRDRSKKRKKDHKPSSSSDVIDLCEDSRSASGADSVATDRHSNESDTRNEPSTSAQNSFQHTRPEASNIIDNPSSITEAQTSRPRPLMAEFLPHPFSNPQISLSDSSTKSHYDQRPSGSNRPYHYRPHSKHLQRDRKFHKKKHSSWHIPTQNY